MSKLTLNTLVGGLASLSKLNANFSAIVTAMQNQVLYRDNPDGEPNSMETDLDMNGQSVLNAAVVETSSLKIGGEWIVPNSSGTSIFVVVTNAPYSADNTGASGASTAIQAAIDACSAAGGGVVYFPAGDYSIDTMLVTKNNVNLLGETSVGYAAATARATRLVRHADCQDMFSHAGSLYWVSSMELEGNAGQNEASRCSAFLRPTSGGGSGLWLDQVTVSNFWHVGYHATSFGGVYATKSTFSDCITAFLNPSDSVFTGNLFTRMSYASISAGTGAIRITDNMFEFHQDSGEAAYPIVLSGNANEVLIHGNRFDRNAGNSVLIFNITTKRPRDITISDNHFMRCAWGTDLARADRASIKATGCDRLHVTGNRAYAANSNPSLIRGLVSPNHLLVYSGCTDVTERDNACDNLPGKIYLKTGVANPHSVAPLWTESSAASGKWYLTDNVDATDNPYILEPDAVVVDGVKLTKGTIGTLAAQQWAWGDTNSLGFSTVYVRITGDGTPSAQEIYAVYDTSPVESRITDSGISASTGNHNDKYTDVYRVGLAGRTQVGTAAATTTDGTYLSVVVPDTHALSVGSPVLLDGYVPVGASSIPRGVYFVLAIVPVGPGYDSIVFESTAVADTGTIDMYKVTSSTFVLGTATTCPTSAALPLTLQVVATESTSTTYFYGEFPVLLRNVSSTTSLAKGTRIVHASSQDVDWDTQVDAATDVVLDVDVDSFGRELTVKVYNVGAAGYTQDVLVGLLR